MERSETKQPHGLGLLRFARNDGKYFCSPTYLLNIHQIILNLNVNIYIFLSDYQIIINPESNKTFMIVFQLKYHKCNFMDFITI